MWNVMRNCCVLKCQVRLTKDKETKENKGFAFVTFTDKDSAQRAVEDVQDKDYKVV
jgi:heterogeneous nuclear ribonucleoprotein R